MRNSKNSKSVIEILQAMAESGMLKPEQRQDISKALRSFKKTLRTGNHREVSQAVEEVARIVIKIIRDEGQSDG